jgi:hypothetical protein
MSRRTEQLDNIYTYSYLDLVSNLKKELCVESSDIETELTTDNFAVIRLKFGTQILRKFTYKVDLLGMVDYVTFEPEGEVYKVDNFMDGTIQELLDLDLPLSDVSMEIEGKAKDDAGAISYSSPTTCHLGFRIKVDN